MLRVNGGPAGSGKVVKRERGGEWQCKCELFPSLTPFIEGLKQAGFRTHRGYWSRCPDCGAKRP